MEHIRSWVRVIITILSMGAFLAASLYLIWFFTTLPEVDSTSAMAIYATLGSMANAAVGLWSGGRSAQKALETYMKKENSNG